MQTQEPLDAYLDSQEEDDSKEIFDALFSCDCETCIGYREETEYVERIPCGLSRVWCECECHQKPEINQEYASWDKPNG